MLFPEKLKIRDVTLRDGLQNEKVFVKTAQKINKIKELIASGFDRLEVTSFVHPKWVPAMQDADVLGQHLPIPQAWNMKH